MFIKYNIRPLVNHHIYRIELNFTATKTLEQLVLPVWIPGSYMIREFSKNINNISAKQNGQLITLLQINKNTWQLDNLHINQLVTIEYQVYAFEFGIRTAFLDNSRGYFNNTSLCLKVLGQESQSHYIQIVDLPDNWQTICGLQKLADNSYIAANYDELIDCPMELGDFTVLEFRVLDTSHYFVLSGTIHKNFDNERFLKDVIKICEYQIKLFGDIAPFSEYYFILNLGGDIYTGLEHRNSSLLLAPYYSLPLKHLTEINEHYQKLLSLISHEYFHAWNVKRIRPVAFAPYNLSTENYTKLLWWFEGITSYYDDLVLYRTGLISQEKYLTLILENINNVYKFAGVNNQSLAKSSLEAWTKYYRQNEDSPNIIVSYYTKGALVGMCLDLLIRINSQNSLDDVLRKLFNNWQKDNFSGINDQQLVNLINQVAQIDLSDFITMAIETTNEIPLNEIFKDFGLELITKEAENFAASGKLINCDIKLNQQLDLGCKLVKKEMGYLVTTIYHDTSAQKAGLAPNDLIIAIDNIKLIDIKQALNSYVLGQQVIITLFRQANLLEFKLELNYSIAKIRYLKINSANNLQNWL